VDEEFLTLLTRANDAALTHDRAGSARAIARRARRLASAYVWDRSAYHRDATVVDSLEWMISELVARQHADGLYDVGNLHSPPDTAFVIQDVCMVYTLLGGSPSLASILRTAGPALVSGGVHTPNHRWEISAALARVNALFPDPQYVSRIDEWLAEGIDAAPDGIYSERSSTYAAEVTNPSLLTIARLQNRPALVEYVRRNLEATLYLLEPNGEVDTVASRRQDQKSVRDVWWYLMQFRELALLGADDRFAAVARSIEARGTGDLGDFLADVIEQPSLAASLPTGNAPTDFVHHFPSQSSVRIRRGTRTATIFGGTDNLGVIASGLSTNPTFFKLRTGAAILDSVRLSPNFFGTGHFRSSGLRLLDGAYVLSSEVQVPYHHPLPQHLRNPDGHYNLTSDGRFYSAMNFPDRPKQYRTLHTPITITESSNAFTLTFDFTGDACPYAIELCFRPGGTLTGIVPLDAPDNYHLISGTGSYTVGDDRITFGPGTGNAYVPMDPGELYTHLGATLTPTGHRVYVTGRTPGRQHLMLRC
jgi:hypothetical protein